MLHVIKSIHARDIFHLRSQCLGGGRKRDVVMRKFSTVEIQHRVGLTSKPMHLARDLEYGVKLTFYRFERLRKRQSASCFVIPQRAFSFGRRLGSVISR